MPSADTTDGARWLNETAATNQLLISLDRTGTWFRYHHLLGDVLRLDADQSALDLADAHGRAARWHHEAGDAHDAVEHYLAAGELATAADLIYDEATELMNRGQLRTVADQVARLGPLAEEHAGALVVQGCIALFTGRFAESHRCLEQARGLNPSDDEAGLIVALAIMTNLATGNVADALTEARVADEPFESTQAMTLGGAYVWAGDFDGARPFLEQAERMAPAEGHSFVQAVAPILSAIAHIEDNDTAAAHAEAARAIDIATQHGLSDLAQTALAHSVVARTTEEGRRRSHRCPTWRRTRPPLSRTHLRTPTPSQVAATCSATTTIPTALTSSPRRDASSTCARTPALPAGTSPASRPATSSAPRNRWQRSSSRT